MAKIAYVHNGTAKTATAKNGTKRRKGSARKGGSKKRRRNPSLSLSRVQTFLKKNGMRTASRKRNGATTVSRSRNGILGNTKSDAKQVGFLALGAAVTKGVGRVLAGFAAPYLSQMGLGKYTTIISDGIVALVAVPFIAQKTLGKEASTFGRLGGLLVVGLDGFNMLAPDALAAYNPFIDMSPIVVANGQAAFAPEAVAQIVAQVANSNNPQAEAAKVAGAVSAMTGGSLGYLDSSAYGSGSDDYAGNGLLPMTM